MAARDPTALSQNIEELKTLPYKLNETAYLAVFERDKFKKVLKKQDLLAKIDLLVRKLETTVDVVIEGFVKRSFLLTVSVHRMEELIDLLKNNNVTSQDIVKDWWVLQYSPKLVKERLEVSKANNINPIKTWMVRCTADILQRYIQRRSENKLVLGESTTQEYLSERLQCSQQEANYLILKLPALEKKSMKKMKEIIDFLYAEGFKPYHIYRVPKILLHSVQTTKKRIRELEKQGVQIDSLHILIKSQKQYMQYYQALVKSNINKVRMDEQAG